VAAILEDDLPALREVVEKELSSQD